MVSTRMESKVDQMKKDFTSRFNGLENEIGSIKENGISSINEKSKGFKPCRKN